MKPKLPKITWWRPRPKLAYTVRAFVYSFVKIVCCRNAAVSACCDGQHVYHNWTAKDLGHEEHELKVNELLLLLFAGCC